MIDSQLLARQLPYLRRFARALTGSQETGDGYAMETLQAIASGATMPRSEAMIEEARARQLLFGVFLQRWDSEAAKQSAAPGDAGGHANVIEAADRGLDAITPMARAVFLLRTVEGFSTEEVAAMLDCTTRDVELLADRAGREIASHISTSVLIIEDEPVIAMDLEALVEQLGHRITRIVRTQRDAVEAVAQEAPGLVLADIRLADGSSGLDAVNEILQNCNVPVVFITAYPERLLTGERPEPTFLITKPFLPGTVKAVVSQALFFDRKASLAGTPLTGN
jgi:CheY-like chemotaxis protein